MKFEVLDHTADLRLKIYGNSYKSIFENAITAVASMIIGDTSNIVPETTIKISIESNNYNNLLIKLINDFLFYFETDNIIYYMAQLDVKKTQLSGTLSGIKVDKSREYEYVIKAATYYGMVVSPEKGYAIIVLDV
ncbi:MAG: archease [Ferroplasma sp.]